MTSDPLSKLSNRSEAPSEWRPIGRIGRPRGLRGHLFLQLDRPRTVAPGFSRGGWGEVRVGDAGTVVRARVLRMIDPRRREIQVEGVANRTDAEGLVGASFEVRAGSAPDGCLDEADRMLGATVCRLGDDVALGEVTAIEHNGAQALLVVGTRGMVPLVPSLVPKFDAATGRVWVDCLDGLLDDVEA